MPQTLWEMKEGTRSRTLTDSLTLLMGLLKDFSKCQLKRVVISCLRDRSDDVPSGRFFDRRRVCNTSWRRNIEEVVVLKKANQEVNEMSRGQ